MSNEFTYDKFDPDAVRKAFESLDIQPEPKRNLVIFTGPNGHKMINTLIEREIWITFLRHTHAAQLVTIQEFDRLKQMLESPDYESQVLAQEIIKAKQPTQDVNSIHNGGS